MRVCARVNELWIPVRTLVIKRGAMFCCSRKDGDCGDSSLLVRKKMSAKSFKTICRLREISFAASAN
jgi:hypothetical protein